MSGLLVVFSVLVILIVLCWLLGKILNLGKKSGSSDQPKEKKKAAKANEASAPAAASIQNEQNEENEGVLVAIFAAVASMMGGKPFALKSIRRADKAGRNIWNAAGLAENTRPF